MSDKKLLNETTIRRFWKLANIAPLQESTPSYLQEEEEELDEVHSKDDDKETMEEGEGHGGKKFDARTKKKDIPHAGQPQRDLGNPKKKMEEVKTDDDKEKMEESEDLQEKAYARDDDDDKDKKMEESEDLQEKAYARDDDVDEMAKMMKRDDEDPVKKEMDDPMDEPGMEGPEEDIDAEVTVPESDVDALRKARDVIDQILSAADDGEPEMDMDDDGDDDIGDELSDEEDDDPMMEDEDLDEDMLEEMISTITNRVSQRLVKEALIRKLTK
ncbi:MAG: hypothetical protein CMB95_06885 [Flavobacteriaceae bacterium]|nr:hypothetical protein [Flavobacteriaceae bacterium]|tara:strand:- start:2356 stop:3171 length:816 start_codon:yes stop_codon:yes gene_type:complete